MPDTPAKVAPFRALPAGARNERCERTANEWLARTDARLARETARRSARTNHRPAPRFGPLRMVGTLGALVFGAACFGFAFAADAGDSAAIRSCVSSAFVAIVCALVALAD